MNPRPLEPKESTLQQQVQASLPALEKILWKLNDPETTQKFCELAIFLIAFYVVTEFNDIPQGCNESWSKTDGTHCRNFSYPTGYDFMSCGETRASCFQYLENVKQANSTGRLTSTNISSIFPYNNFCQCMYDISGSSAAYCDFLPFHIITVSTGFITFIYALATTSFNKIVSAYILWTALVFACLFIAGCTSEVFWNKFYVTLTMILSTTVTLLILQSLQQLSARIVHPSRPPTTQQPAQAFEDIDKTSHA